MDNNHVYGSLADGQDDLYTYEDGFDQHYTTDSQGGPYNDDAPWGIQRFQTDTGPWNQNNVDVVQGQTWLSSDGYVPTSLPNNSDEAVQGSAEGAQPAEPEEKDKKKKKKSEETDVKRDAKGYSKKDGKDGSSKKKHHGHKGHRHGHGHSRAAT